MQLTGTRFGTIDYTTEDVVTFHHGLIGFPELRDYVLLSHKPDSPFRWLQSVEEPALAFLITDPTHYVPEYAPSVREDQVTDIELTEETPQLLFTTASIPGGDPKAMTLNLAGPIIVNAATRKAKQLVLEGDAYTIKHRVFPAADRTSEKLAA